MQTIEVRTLGEFSLRSGENVICETGNRSRRVWSLLAYLVCHRGQVVPQKKLIDQLWGDAPDVSNPENALRIVLYRGREQLDRLYENAGHSCIQYKDNGYVWNPEVPVVLDYEQFETLCQIATDSEDQRLENILKALELYQGEFLPRQSSDGWVIPVCTHFQNNFLMIAQEAAQLLSDRGRYDEATAVCRRAAAAEPYYEPTYQALMQVLAAQGKSREAADVYEELSRRLFHDFGIRPSEETRAVYRTAAHSPENRTMAMDEVLENLRETESLPGALQCDYDYFKILCHSEARAMERSGTVTHIALLSVVPGTDKPLNKRSQTRIMEQLGQSLRANLRRGDAISQCSVSQYIIMLPKANYENSCMVCRRIVSAFHRANAHVNVKVNFMVQPLSPSLFSR